MEGNDQNILREEVLTNLTANSAARSNGGSNARFSGGEFQSVLHSLRDQGMINLRTNTYGNGKTE